MPFIQVTMIEGRTVEQKHALIRELTAGAQRALDVPADRVRVAIYEVGADDWGIGGQPFAAVRGPVAPPAEEPPAPAAG